MGFNKRPLFFGQERLRPIQMQYIKQPFSMDDLRGKTPGYKNRILPDRVQKIGDFVIICHDIRRNGSPVDRIDPVSFWRIQGSVFIL